MELYKGVLETVEQIGGSKPPPYEMDCSAVRIVGAAIGCPHTRIEDGSADG